LLPKQNFFYGRERGWGQTQGGFAVYYMKKYQVSRIAT